jgi:hypothetical protein
VGQRPRTRGRRPGGRDRARRHRDQLRPGVHLEPLRAALAENPHVKCYSDRNGYTRALVNRERWRSEFVAVDAKLPSARPQLAAAHAIEAGRPGAVPD